MSTKIELARALSQYVHQGQKYGVYDYFEEHIEDVVERVTEFTKDFQCKEMIEFCIITAYLHDVLEDSTTLEETVWDLFGKHICIAVTTLSKSYCYSDRDGDVIRTKPKQYAEYIEDIKSDDVALIVKLCDTRSNLRASLRDNNYKRIEKYNTQLMLLEK